MHTQAGRLNAILNRTLDCFVGCWIGYQSRTLYIVYMMKQTFTGTVRVCIPGDLRLCRPLQKQG